MLAIIGILVVFGAVLGGFLLEKGNPYVLFQPAEMLIVGGAALGIILVANPWAVIRQMAAGMVAAFRPAVRTHHVFLSHMRLLYEVFEYSRRGRIEDLEDDIDNPQESKIFGNHPKFVADRVTRQFVCDSLRMVMLRVTTADELDHLMDMDIEVQRRARHEPVSALSSIADALPGLGIVAAVLGVVITMQAIGGSPETVGQKVAAALVGTFIGILLCYGVVGPIAARLEHQGELESQFLQVLRVAIVSFARGAAPILAIEYARRSIPEDLRPSYSEMEITIRRDAQVTTITRPDLEEAPNVEVKSA